MSNPLRHLATAIVKACQTKDNAKHVKQSTVLDVLTKHEGYRSIQARDNATATRNDDKPLSSDVIALRGLLYANYPHSDLLPIELGEAITFKGSLVSHPEWGSDAPFAIMWDLLSEDLYSSVDKLEDWYDLCNELNSVIGDNEEAVENALDAFPPRIKQFLKIEFSEVADDSMEAEQQSSEKRNALGNFQHEVDCVIEALRDARSVQDR